MSLRSTPFARYSAPPWSTLHKYNLCTHLRDSLCEDQSYWEKSTYRILGTVLSDFKKDNPGDPPGQDPVQPTVGDPASAGGLD